MSWLVSWVLPLAAGVSMWLALNPRRRAGWLANAAGHGVVFGMLLTALASVCFSRADTLHAVAHAGVWLALFAAAAGAIAWRRMSRTSDSSGADSWNWLGFGVLAVLLGARAWMALREILLRPTYPWDAWDAWEVKSKAWVLAGHYVPFVSTADWFAHPIRELYTSLAWGYPSTLAWVQVWFASGAGGWIEPLVNLPWFALWFGLLLAHYGQWRALGVGQGRALCGTYALGSLPLLNVHVALAGYADLWIATLFGIAVLAWLRWSQRREPEQLLIAIGCAALLPLLKIEGAVWFLLCLATVLYGLLSRRWRRGIVVTAVIGAIALVALRGARVPLPGLGWVTIDHGTLDIPLVGRLTIAWHGAALRGVLNSLFVQPNWHLLWWIVPIVVIWRWQLLWADESLRRLGALLLVAIGCLVFLFVFTDAAIWAESYTAINRLIMHLVPATITMLILLLRDVTFDPLLRDTPRGSAARTTPA